MNELDCKIPDLTLTKPSGLSSQLFFQVYNGANAIAFAQLSSRAPNQFKPSSLVFPVEVSAPGVSYCLKNIEVSQHYRNKGVGSALLKEVIAFCKQERVNSLYGEAKGDMDSLRKWYIDEGFNLDSIDNIQLQLNK